MRRLTLILAVVALLVPALAATQVDPQRSPPQQRQPDPRDTIQVPPFRVEPPVSPLGAAVRSLLLPGWGQSIVGRKVTGAVFVFWEGLTLAMVLKSVHQQHYLEDIGEGADEEQLEGKRSEVQDWAVLLAFNHLLAAAEAYVSTHLWDFPADLDMRQLPNGDPAAGVRVYW
jgi:hypothetical protein